MGSRPILEQVFPKHSVVDFGVMPNDAPPNSLKYSNARLKVKTTEGVQVCSLTRNISGGKKGMLDL